MDWIIYALAGGAGGLVTYLDWKITKQDQYEKTKVTKLIRNFCVGAVVGGYVATSPIIAFIAGTAGEFYIQRLGKAIGQRYGK